MASIWPMCETEALSVGEEYRATHPARVCRVRLGRCSSKAKCALPSRHEQTISASGVSIECAVASRTGHDSLRRVVADGGQTGPLAFRPMGASDSSRNQGVQVADHSVPGGVSEEGIDSRQTRRAVLA